MHPEGRHTLSQWYALPFAFGTRWRCYRLKTGVLVSDAQFNFPRIQRIKPDGIMPGTRISIKRLLNIINCIDSALTRLHTDIILPTDWSVCNHMIHIPKKQQETIVQFPADYIKSDPVGIRTQDPQLRRLLLYPAELPDQTCIKTDRQNRPIIISDAKLRFLFDLTKRNSRFNSYYSFVTYIYLNTFL